MRPGTPGHGTGEPPPPDAAAGLAGFGDAFDAAAVGMAVVGLDGRYLRVNRALCEFLGRAAEELVGSGFDEVAHPDDAEAERTLLRRLLDGERERYRIEKRFVRADGQLRWGACTGALVRDAEGRPRYLFKQVTDVTEHKRTEESLRESEARLRALLESAPDGILVVDGSGRIVTVNARMRAMFGYEPSELVGRPVEELVPERLRAGHHGHRGGFLADPRTRPMGRGIDLTARRKDGTEFPVEIGLGSAREGGATLVTCVVTDITERKRAEAELAHQATHDHLTGLPNRALFLDRVRTALARLKRRPGLLAVLFLDLDRFKVVNDSLGHGAGDEVLVAVAARLPGLVRASDTVARFGGDEFALLCEDLAGEVGAAQVAARVLEVVGAPFLLGHREVVVTPSVGVAVAGSGAEAPEDLLRDADAAMYRAKERGRARYELFDEAMRARALERLETENALRRAVERDELRVHYQPVVALGDGAVVGAEALVRWQRRGVGLVPPGDFVPLAEETGLIVPVGTWVLEQACRWAARWRANRKDGAPFTVAVNLSMRQLAQPDLVDVVARALAEAGLPPEALTLELTESSLMVDAEASVARLRRLKDLGVGLAIDDFGTGYSSLAYLRRFPVGVLKVDRSFVDGLGREADDSAIVAAVVGLAHALGIPALAEGVETPGQLAELRALGCDLAQGYHLGRPVPPEAFGELFSCGRTAGLRPARGGR